MWHVVQRQCGLHHCGATVCGMVQRLLWGDADDAVRAVHDGVEGAIRSGAGIADTTGIFENDFLICDFVIFDFDDAHFLEFEGSDDEVISPFRHQVAGIDIDAANGNGGGPVNDWLLHTRHAGFVGDGSAVVVDAVGDDRPAIVAADTDGIQLIAAFWSVFGLPDRAADGMHNQALLVAMAVGEDAWQRTSRLEKGIIIWYGAIIIDAMDFAVWS